MRNDTIHFHIEPSSGVPIYRQLMDQVETLVSSGELITGSLLPSVRQMAASLDVNMMTVSKAYTRLEERGLLERIRGKGMRVTAIAPSGSISSRKKELGASVEPLIVRGRQLGLTDEQILAVVKSQLRQRRR